MKDVLAVFAIMLLALLILNGCAAGAPVIETATTATPGTLERDAPFTDDRLCAVSPWGTASGMCWLDTRFGASVHAN